MALKFAVPLQCQKDNESETQRKFNILKSK